MPPRSASYWKGKGLLGCAGGLSCFEEEPPQVSGACGKLPGSMESPATVVCATALYYEDPDRNSVELNVDNYGDSWTSGEHLRNSPEFAKNPMGTYVDPNKMVAARE
jgi:hypothetical protein